MAFFDELKAKADTNGDGKLTSDDIQHFREKYPEQSDYLSGLQARADANNDGKVDFADAKNMADDVITNVKDFFKK